MTLNEYLVSLNSLVEYGLGDVELELIKFTSENDNGRPVILLHDSIFAYDLIANKLYLMILADKDEPDLEEQVQQLEDVENMAVNEAGDKKKAFALMLAKGKQLEDERNGRKIAGSEVKKLTTEEQQNIKTILYAEPPESCETEAQTKLDDEERERLDAIIYDRKTPEPWEDEDEMTKEIAEHYFKKYGNFK